MLFASLERFGILHPPLLWSPPEGGFAILDGFERLQWAQAGGLQEALFVVLSPEVSKRELWRIRIQTLLFGPPLNGVQKADAVEGLSSRFSPEEIRSEFLPLLRVPQRSGGLESWRLLSRQDSKFLRSVAREEISERVALELVHWEPEASWKIANILMEIKCSASIQWEIVERVSEISMREETSRMEVLTSIKENLPVDAANVDHRRKTTLLRDILTRRRLPRLKAEEERFHGLMKKAALPPGLRILHPPFFEGCDWQAHLHFDSPGRLQELLDACSRLNRSHIMTEILARSRLKSHDPGKP